MLTGLSGAFAIALIWLLVAVEEAGVPLPMFPGDGLLLAAEVLLATGRTSPWVFMPVAFAADVAGSLAGYAWAKRLGARGLEGGRPFPCGRPSDSRERSPQAKRANGRRDRPSVPGTRVYTHLVAGAVGMPPLTIVAGLVPSSLVWLAIFTGLGYALGQRAAACPAESASPWLQS